VHNERPRVRQVERRRIHKECVLGPVIHPHPIRLLAQCHPVANLRSSPLDRLTVGRLLKHAEAHSIAARLLLEDVHGWLEDGELTTDTLSQLPICHLAPEICRLSTIAPCVAICKHKKRSCLHVHLEYLQYFY